MKTYTVGQFNENYLPILDGVSLTIKNYAYWLNKNMGKTYVISPSFPDYKDSDDFPVIRYKSVYLPMKPPYRMGLPLLDKQFHDDLTGIPFDIVHCHTPFSAGKCALRLAHSNNIPIVCTFHVDYKKDLLRLINDPYIVKVILKDIVEFYSSVDEVWVPQASAANILKEYGYNGKTVVMDNGTDFNQSEKNKSIRKSARANLNINENKLVFLYVGQLIYEKNLSLILNALTKLENVNYEAYFVGQGYAADEFKSFAVEHGIDDKVNFTGTITDREKLKDYYAAADLFLYPSEYNNAPLAVREAASMHTPSVLIKNSIAAEIIQDNINGFLIENNVDSLVNKITAIMYNRSLLDKVGAQAANSISSSWEKIMDKVKDRYLYLIQKKAEQNKVKVFEEEGIILN